MPYTVHSFENAHHICLHLHIGHNTKPTKIHVIVSKGGALLTKT